MTDDLLLGRVMLGAFIHRAVPLVPRHTDEAEWMDLGGPRPDILAGNLRDLRRVNRWLGGTALTIDGVKRLIGEYPPGERLTIADIGAGTADIPAALVRWASARGLRPMVLAIDVSPDILAFAPEVAGVERMLADGRRLPLPGGSVDVATCSLTLHHLLAHDGIELLGEMARVARRGVVVNDLVRTWPALAGAWLLSRALSRNAMTRNDAPLSVRRAYTRSELMRMAAAAGLRPLTVRSRLGYRVAMTAVPA